MKKDIEIPDEAIVKAINKAVENAESKDEEKQSKSKGCELKQDVKEREDTLSYIRDVMERNNMQHPDDLIKYWDNKHRIVEETFKRLEESDPSHTAPTPTEEKEAKAYQNGLNVGWNAATRTLEESKIAAGLKTKSTAAPSEQVQEVKEEEKIFSYLSNENNDPAIREYNQRMYDKREAFTLGRDSQIKGKIVVWADGTYKVIQDGITHEFENDIS